MRCVLPSTGIRSPARGSGATRTGQLEYLVGDTGGAEGSLARAVRVLDRTTALRRTADDTDPVERIIVANADQLVIVTSLVDPPPRARLIDRCLVAAYDAGVSPLLCLTKTDLADPGLLLEMYEPLGVPYVVTRYDEEPTVVRDALKDRISVLVGHSGVGKSTLVNALVPGADHTIGEVSEVTGRGRHTTTRVVALPLPEGGWVIDTPGIRSFGLAHVDPRHLIEAFPDLFEITQTYDGGCPRGCTHAATEPECALDDAVRSGAVNPVRVTSYRRLLESRESTESD